MSSREARRSSVDLYWLPLGAGGHSVRLNGRLYEAVTARLEGRAPCDLFHSALVVHGPDGRFVIEQAPVAGGNGAKRGVVGVGAVGGRWAGYFRIFRYEVRRWRDGEIPDVGDAVESPRHLSDDPQRAQRLLELVPSVPTPVWGRDELRAGEAWNSNSVISWLLARSGIAVDAIRPPAGGRAPGWEAGLVVARRQHPLRVEGGSVVREDGTISTYQRESFGIAVDVTRLERLYWREVSRATFGLAQFSGDAIRMAGRWPVLLRFGPAVNGRRKILGGWFARRPGGTIAWRSDGLHVSVEVEGFAPFLRGPLWRLESLLHARVGRQFLARVERETP